MSNPLKKITKKVKKVFKKVVSVAKKVVKSDLFKVIVIASAIYFTAGAVAGMMPAAAGGAAAGAGSLAPITTAAVPNLATGVGSTMAANTAGAAATTGGFWSGAAAAVKGVTAPQAALASGLLTTGGSAMSAYAQGEQVKELEKAKERERERLIDNSETELDVAGSWRDSRDKRDNAVAVDSNGNSNYESPIAKLSNVEDQSGDMSYYNNATNSYDTKEKQKATA